MEAEQVEERVGNQNYVTEEKKLIWDHTRGKRLQKVINWIESRSFIAIVDVVLNQFVNQSNQHNINFIVLSEFP